MLLEFTFLVTNFYAVPEIYSFPIHWGETVGYCYEAHPFKCNITELIQYPVFLMGFLPYFLAYVQISTFLLSPFTGNFILSAIFF